MVVIIDFPSAPRRTFSEPTAVLRADTTAEVRAVIRAAEQAAATGSWVAGFVSYEAASAFDTALRVHRGSRMPLAWFSVFERAGSAVSSPAPLTSLPAWELSTTASAYSEDVERVREEIARGRTYQLNLTARLVTEFGVDPFAYYEHLRRAQGVGYHAYIDTGDFSILSASPELFFEMHGRRIRTRPMKGTRPRGRWPAEDEALANELAHSEKDRAENLMIVDLLRNDLGRVAEPGSVAVKALFESEQYRTVHQLTSTIEAKLRADVSLVDVFAALFPCGSVTGAPKVSTMELITELEREPREVYCGALGVIEPGGTATFNVPIRTVWLDHATRRGVYGTGGGITYDSSAADEYEEIVTKAAVLMEAWPDFELLETMRAENGAIIRLDRHIARLLASARYFGLPAREAEIRGALNTAIESSTDPRRIRLLLDQAGTPRVEVLEIEPASTPRVALAQLPVSSADRFLFHKTTHRRVYNDRLLPGYWDVMLWNEREEITEFTRGNVVVEIDGERITPPIECGLLAGTFRAELLEASMLEERVVHVADLRRATTIWFINSLREWVEVFHAKPPSTRAP